VNSGTTLVTGAAGFVGSRLVPALVAAGREVIGVHLPGLPAGSAAVTWLACDLADRAATERLIRETRPSALVHLAALAAPAEAERAPLDALRANYLALDHLLCAVARDAPACRFLFVSTGDAYGGAAPGARPFREEDPLRPPNLYAATKAAGERRVAWAVERHDLEAVTARPFNHTGPGRPTSYAEASFAEQLARMERGQLEPVLRVGNLAALRDVSDVRDVVAAYVLLLTAGERGAVYNVCSGRGRSVQSLLDSLVARARVKPRIEVDPARFRPLPAAGGALVGDPSRLRALGWQPTHSADEALSDLLDAFRSQR
jgi:GDP-4-dehydro-6-deoxy-D-mannose reductase